jgi:multidrug efflux pump subunit AcrB
MTHANSDAEQIKKTRNTARYFVETRHVAWVLLIGTVLWGIYAYVMMPKRKDPEIPVRIAAAMANWPGASAEKMEEQITRRMEEKIAENSKIKKIESTTRGGVTVVTIELQEEIKNTAQEFDDIKMKLDSLNASLPSGAFPIQFIKDFGDTTALMLTVASPMVSDVEVQLRADSLRRGIEEARGKAAADARARRASLAYAFPATLDPHTLRRVVQQLADYAAQQNLGKDVRVFEGRGFLGIDAATDLSEERIQEGALRFLQERMRTAELHPDVWRAIVVVDPKETETKLRAVAESKYSYRELDDFTDRLQRRLEGVEEVSKVQRSGVLSEQVYLEYSQDRLAAYGFQMSDLKNVLGARNITLPGGTIETGGKTIGVDPSGELVSEHEIGSIAVTSSAAGAPVYLRDLFEITRDYENPARFLNKFTARDKNGTWQRTRAITLAVSMRSGKQIAHFGAAVDRAIAEAKVDLPEDLVLARTSDQPRQVKENVDLFMSSLYEAILLVVVIALLGFWEWRSAVVLAISIPVTLFMTYGFMQILGIDLQQVSIASLIIALGLLVDDPVVAGDAIKRDLALGHKPGIAAWLGPTKLGRAILFATITNIVAYLPFLILPGDTGRFIYSLPVVLTASLVASRLVSMTFIPLLGYYLLRGPKKAAPTDEERRNQGFGRIYSRIVGWSIDHRWVVLAGAAMLVGAGMVGARSLKTSFFPKDLSYLSYVDVWLPEDAPIASTNAVVRRADEVIRATIEDYEKKHPGKDSKPRRILKSITTFVGGGGPRFWSSVSPEQQQLNYAQMVLEVTDKLDTSKILPVLQEALAAQIPGARIDVRQLETAAALGVPVSFRISGNDIHELRSITEEMKDILRTVPFLERIRDDWGADSFSVNLEVNPDRANMAGVTNLDVAEASATGLRGARVGNLRDGKTTIPIVSRLRASERAQLSDIENLYVTASKTGKRVPLRQVSNVSYGMHTEKIRRRDHYRTITVGGFPAEGRLPSEAMALITTQVDALQKRLPPGYKIEVGGEQSEQTKNFKNLVVVLLISVAAIFLALVIQFKNAVKPLIVFAAIPFGVIGALISLTIMGSPFGFMAFLAIISLIGVIVSHVIVLFDFIEEKHEEGAPLREALIDAGILRLRPVLITVGATVFALFPLASHGGPLWEPLCYAQIGGLTVATFITLLIVPVLYAIFVMDLKLVKWAREPAAEEIHATPVGEPLAAE